MTNFLLVLTNFNIKCIIKIDVLQVRYIYMFKKIVSQKLYIGIVNQVRELIRKGKLEPGDKLPSEQQLAKMFDVSRPLIREALCVLEVLGITEAQRGKGNYIKAILKNSLSDQKVEELEKEIDPIELLEARKSIESAIAEIAALKATKRDIFYLNKIFDEIKKSKNDIPTIMKLDKKFHINLSKIADNSILFSIMGFLTEGKRGKLWKKLEEKSWAIPNRFDKYSLEHAEIINAIKNNDKSQAKRAMYKHISEIEKDWFGAIRKKNKSISYSKFTGSRIAQELDPQIKH